MYQKFLTLKFILLFLILTFLNSNSTAQIENPNMKKDNSEKEFVPEWAKKVVWYQIFPERFYNGDKNNDPKLKDIEGAYPHDVKSPWQIHPWTSDWYELQPYEKENGKDIWFNIQRRRYGGDLQGIINKLDYLKELGITALYLNPVFAAPSLHKYDQSTYHHVDPNFGPDPEGDRKIIASEIPDDPKTWKWTSADKLALKLIEEAHKRGMKIIFDGVFNHMGITSFAFKDVEKNQQNSKFKNWFSVKSWDDSEKGTKFQYEGWFGVKELPEIKEDENGIVKEPKDYIFAITKRWMDPEGNGNLDKGIDGWRLDVAFCVKHEFWKDWRKHVKSINPEAYLTAEVIDSVKEVKTYLNGDEFDAVMNYNFAFTASEFFIDSLNRISVAEFDKLLKQLQKDFPQGVAYVQQNLFDSHDANRVTSHIVNKDLAKFRDWGNYFGASQASNKNYKVRKPNDYEYQIQKLMAILQMTYVGAPMVYYGDEVGMWGANDPDCRKPMVWKEFNYEDEVYNPDQTKREADVVEVHQSMLEHYKKLIHIRNENEALQLGDFTTLLIDDKNSVYAFERNYKDQKAIVILNNSNEKQSVEIPVNKISEMQDLLNNNSIKIENSKIKIDISPKWGAILVK